MSHFHRTLTRIGRNAVIQGQRVNEKWPSIYIHTHRVHVLDAQSSHTVSGQDHDCVVYFLRIVSYVYSYPLSTPPNSFETQNHPRQRHSKNTTNRHISQNQKKKTKPKTKNKTKFQLYFVFFQKSRYLFEYLFIFLVKTG